MKPEIELLKEIIKMFEDIYSSSGYGQQIIYAAKENGIENWYSRAKQIIAESENR